MTTNFEKHTTKNPIGRWALQNFNKKLISLIKPLEVETILDVGAGEGFTLNHLRQEKIGNAYEGIEYTDEAIRIGKKLHPDIFIKKGSIYELPYRDNSFDLVLCTEVLEHLDIPEKGLKELVRVSKKYVLLTVPNEPYFTIQRLLRGQNILHFGAHPEHIQLWSNKGFQLFVKSQDLKLVSIRHPFPWTMLLAEKK